MLLFQTVAKITSVEMSLVEITDTLFLNNAFQILAWLSALFHIKLVRQNIYFVLFFVYFDQFKMFCPFFSGSENLKDTFLRKDVVCEV